MSEVQLKQQIQAPIETVFDRASDFPNAASTITSIVKVEMLSDGPVAVGSRFRETRVMFGREATEEMEVKTFERPRRYVLEATSHGSHYLTTFNFREKGGGTEMEMNFQATPLSFFAKVMGFFLNKMMMKTVVTECGKDLKDLKAAIEGAED